MKRLCLATIMHLTLIAAPAAAQCFADYKAKQDDPLRLHYGVAALTGTCTTAQARVELTQRLQARGWTLLNVLSVFGSEGLASRKDSAGPYYLRF